MRGWLAVLVATVAAAGCGATTTPTRAASEVRVVGSDTMLVLNRRLAAAFMAAHPGVAVVVEGGGTATGVTALLAGEADLVAASRPLTAGEVGALYQRFGTLGVTSPVAADALSVYLHPANRVRDLSVTQLAGIFGGEIRDWREVGGEPGAIRVLIRPPSSGTHGFFRDHVLRGRAYRADAEVLSRTLDIVGVVEGDPTAIGYGGLAYGAELVHCAIDGIRPPEKPSEGLGRYPLSRHLSLVAAAPATGPARAFLDWCLAPEGQGVVREAGYVPLWASPEVAVP